MYSGQERQIVFVAVSRAEVGQLKAIVHEQATVDAAMALLA